MQTLRAMRNIHQNKVIFNELSLFYRTMSSSICLMLLWCLYSVSGQIPREITLEYQYIEEQDPHYEIGNLFKDAKLQNKYNHTVQPRLKFIFEEQSKQLRQYFEVTNKGMLRSAAVIDRDKLCPNLDICDKRMFISMQPYDFYHIFDVTVHILDINDNVPKFPNKNVIKNISETAVVGHKYDLPAAQDPDSINFSIINYRLLKTPSEFQLRLEKANNIITGVNLVLRKKLDREIKSEYRVVLLAIDGGSPAFTGTCNIKINILDVNDHKPLFVKDKYVAQVNEDTPKGSTVVRTQANDPDAGANGRVTYSFWPQTQTTFGRIFGINSTTGGIYLKEQLNFEDRDMYQLTVIAQDNGLEALSDRTEVTIKVMDVNDHYPVMTVKSEKGDNDVSVSEAAPVGTFVAHLAVVDLDNGINGLFNCTMRSSTFRLRKMYRSAYSLLTTVLLDRERRSHYSIPVTCTDMGRKPLKTVTWVNITVRDENDHTPEFNKREYRAQLEENTQKGYLVTSVKATDPDSGNNGNIVYTIDEKSGIWFEIHPHHGEIKTKIPVDYETYKEMVVVVEASDYGSPVRRSASANIYIQIIDTNDEPPSFSQNSWDFEMFENQPPLHVPEMKVEASDPDSAPYNKFVFSIPDTETDVRWFSIDPIDGRITPKETLDYEYQSQYEFMVVVKSTQPPYRSDAAYVTIKLRDMNDNSPEFDFPSDLNNTVQVSPMVPPGSVISRFKAHDADSGINGRFNFIILSGNNNGYFKIYNRTGELILTKGFIEEDIHTLIIMARDLGYPKKSSVAKVHIVVNGTIPYFGSSGSLLTDQGKHVISGMAAACGIVVLALLIAILFIAVRRRRERPKPPGHYPVKIDTQSPEHIPRTPPPKPSYEPNNIEKYSNNYGNIGSYSTAQMHQPSPVAKPSSISGVQPERPNNTSYNNGAPVTTTVSTTPNGKDNKVQHWLSQLGRDSDSSCSVEGSNTDSGRGASEEGDHNNSISPSGYGSLKQTEKDKKNNINMRSLQRPPSIPDINGRNTGNAGIMNSTGRNKNNTRTVRFGDEPTVHSYMGTRNSITEETPSQLQNQYDGTTFGGIDSINNLGDVNPPSNQDVVTNNFNSNSPRYTTNEHNKQPPPSHSHKKRAGYVNNCNPAGLEEQYLMHVLKENLDTLSVDSSATSGSYVVENQEIVRLRDFLDSGKGKQTVV